LRRREALRGWLAGLAAASVLLAGCGGSGAPGLTGRTSSTDPSLNPTAPLAGTGTTTGTRTTSHSRPSSSDGRAPALRHLQALLVRAERKAGPRTGLLVYDMTTRRTLFTREASVARPPASVTKIFTTVALLRLLGPDVRLHTEVLGTGHLGRHGVWQGNLDVRGDGDPTFGDGGFIRAWDGGHGAEVSTLVAQLRRRGIRRVTGRVYGDGSRFDDLSGGPFTGGAPDVPDYGGEMSALTFDHGATGKGLSPPAYAARQLARTLRAAHIRVKAAAQPARTPRRARRLAVVASPPLSVLLKLMDVPSDDLFADLLTKQLGYRLTGHGTLPAGAREILAALRPYHVAPRLEDGSGLAPADRTTPAQVMSLLRQVWPTPVGHMLDAALPVVGVSGTVAGMGLHTAAQGHCVAKTGTLDTVTNLAGVCAGRGRQEIGFVVFIDGPYNWQAIPILSRMVGAIAGY
jgi:D-alanyl-D-alanine carboxypeptidase/D-alanyl-D-alanine-endopeptidase (penicillin-binding protein 4)